MGKPRYARYVKIVVQVKINAKADEIQSVDGLHYTVRLHAPARQGKANEALIQILSAHLDVPRSRIRIVSGFSSRIKIVEID